MIVEHECSGCFKKMISEAESSPQPTGEVSVTVSAYCSECCEEKPLNDLLRTCVMTVYAEKFRGIGCLG